MFSLSVTNIVAALALGIWSTSSNAFQPQHAFVRDSRSFSSPSCTRRQVSSSDVATSEDVKAAPVVSGEELEIMLADMEEPLVLDAYATWCGPCILMAPEFEEAAKELKSRGVRFAKLDTDKDPEMAGRLNVMGLPTLLFLDKAREDEESGARATLKQRIEGAIKKEKIVELCEHHYFGGPAPESLF